MNCQEQLSSGVLTSLLREVEARARAAGDILLSYHRGDGVLVKSFKADGSFATQADLASEKYLIEALRPLVPGAGFYAEETGVQKGNDYQWVIDPLDGTTNFAHGLPHFCVSIALTYRNEPVLGVVYQPAIDELFSAQKGEGAFLNGKRLSISQETQLSQSVVVMCNEDLSGFLHAVMPYPIHERPHTRDFGAAALDSAYCAAGRVEVCFYKMTKWWDIAAGSLLIKEAGGTFSSLQGGQIGPDNTSFIGGAQPIFEEVTRIVRKTAGV